MGDADGFLIVNNPFCLAEVGARMDTILTVFFPSQSIFEVGVKMLWRL